MVNQLCIALLCNGPLENSAKIKDKISQFDTLIAVDGGINHCYNLGLKPAMIIGDFDSADPLLLEHFPEVPQKRFPKDKDKTDLEIALEFVFHADVEEIVVFGAVGDRTDHTLANLILLSRYPGKVFLESDKERLFVIDQKVELATYPGQTISLIPLNGPSKGIHTENLKWKLENGTLDKQFIGLSNEALADSVSISVKQGDLLCCIND